MENTYWNETGKHQSFISEALDKAPSFGFTNNSYLNALISLSNLYYDTYNNGGCNIDDRYIRDFKKHAESFVSHSVLCSFVNENHAEMERNMDLFLEYLKDKSLDYDAYNVWISYDDKCFSLVKPPENDGKQWTPVTFGDIAVRSCWCSDQEMFLGFRDITAVIESQRLKAGKGSGLPEFCYSISPDTDELVILIQGKSGCFSSGREGNNRERNCALANRLNEKLGVTQAQITAMEFGSTYGWDKPGADPKMYMKPSLREILFEAAGKTGSNLGITQAKKHAVSR